MKNTRSILFALFCLGPATHAFCSGLEGTAKQCTAEADNQFGELFRALKAKDAHFADMLHTSFKKWRACDDGAVFEGYSKLIPETFAEYPESIPRFLDLMQGNPDFQAFILKHIDTTVAYADELTAVQQNVQKHCPDNRTPICKQIADRCATQIPIAYFGDVERSFRRHAEQVKRSMASGGVRSEATLVSS